MFHLFAAIPAWQLGGLPAATLALMRGTTWAFALSFAAITVVSWRYLFLHRDLRLCDRGSMGLGEAGCAVRYW